MIVVSVYFDELKSRKSGVMFELYIYIFTWLDSIEKNIRICATRCREVWCNKAMKIIEE
jgi:hypothetical protein